MTRAGQLDAERLVCVDGFLDDESCRGLMAELRFAFWRRSTVNNRAADGTVVEFASRHRRSESAAQEFFGPELQALVEGVEMRVCAEFVLASNRLDPWQAIRYGPGDFFELHHDAGLFSDQPEGERVATVLLYLNTPDEGGATCFPDLGLRVEALAGRLLVWLNLTPSSTPDARMRHRASPLRSGAKTVLTTWMRERETVRGD